MVNAAASEIAVQSWRHKVQHLPADRMRTVTSVGESRLVKDVDVKRVAGLEVGRLLA